MTIDWTTFVAEHPGLGDIPSSLRRDARLDQFVRGQTLYRQGEKPRSMLFVLQGELRLLRRSAGGSEMILQRSRGGFIAEASLDARHYHCDVVAAADGQLLAFPRKTFASALQNDAAFNRAWITLLACEVRRQRARAERLSLNSAAERILHYLETEGDHGRVTLSMSRKAWAAELGLSHEALYRTLRQLHTNQTIIVQEKQIALVRHSA
ncbi:MAG: Crp/Fnr family transcriptional regulator [Thiohalophilus sp.]